MQKVSTHPAARHKTRTFTNSLVRYFIILCLTSSTATGSFEIVKADAYIDHASIDIVLRRVPG